MKNKIIVRGLSIASLFLFLFIYSFITAPQAQAQSVGAPCTTAGGQAGYWASNGSTVSGGITTYTCVATPTVTSPASPGAAKGTSAFPTFPAITVPTSALNTVTTLGFDDISVNSTCSTPVPSPYKYINWVNFYPITKTYSPTCLGAAVNNGYTAAAVSPNNSIYTAYANPSSIVAPTGYTINVNSLYATAAWDDGVKLEVKAYKDTAVVYDTFYTLNAAVPALISLNYLNVTRVDFIPTGGTINVKYLYGTGLASHVALDNISVSINSASVAPILTSATVTNPTIALVGSNFDATNNTIGLVSATNPDSTFSLGSNVPSTNSGKNISVAIPATLPDGSYTIRISTPASAMLSSSWSNSLPITINQKSDPSNLTAQSVATPVGQINLAWTTTSNAAQGFIIERAFGTSSLVFTKIASTNTTVPSYADNISGLNTGGQTNYRVKTTFTDLTSSNYSNIATVAGCSSPDGAATAAALKAIYDKLPASVSGQISIPWYLSSVTALYSSDIKKGIADKALNGQSLKNALDTALQAMGGLEKGTSEKVTKFVAESIAALGKKYGLTTNETNLLFAGMLSGDARFTVISFAFDAGSVFKLGLGSKVTYQAQKDTSTPSPTCVILNGIDLSPTTTSPAPTVSSVTPVTGAATPNTFNVGGSGFDTTGNLIKLIPVTQSAMIENKTLQANSATFFETVWKFLKNLIPTAHGQTISTGYYGIDTVQNNGSYLTFSVPTNVPDGTYSVSVSGLNSAWADTSYTIIVSGNGAGDPTSEWSDLTVTDLDTTPTTPTSPASIPALAFYYCKQGSGFVYNLTSSNTCTATNQKTISATLGGYTCPDNHYTLSGTSCSLIDGGVTTATTSPALVVYTCPSATGYVYNFTSSNTCTAGNQKTVAANTLGYVCLDTHYTVSGTTCMINAVPSTTVQPATTVYTCPTASSGNGYLQTTLSSLNTCVSTSPAKTILPKVSYICASGYTLSGTTCTLKDGTTPTISPAPVTTPPATTPTSTSPTPPATSPALMVYTCPVGNGFVYSLTSSNTCVAPNGKSVAAKVLGYVCTDNHYILSGSTCNLINNGVTTSTTMPAVVVYTCTPGNGFYYAITSLNTCTASSPTILAKVLGYACTDNHYTLSGTTCTINATTSATIMPATAVYTCTQNNSSSIYNTGNLYTLSTLNTCDRFGSPLALATVLNYICPVNYTLSGKTCNATNANQTPPVSVPVTVPAIETPPTVSPVTTIPATKTYSCPTNQTLDAVAGTCSATTNRPVHGTPATTPASVQYSCPTGYTLNSATQTCSSVVSLQTSTSTTTASVWNAVMDWLSNLFK